MINTQGVSEKFETFPEIVKRNVCSKIDKIIWGRLMIHIYENPLESEVDLIARITSVCLVVCEIPAAHTSH